jgi:hypothetical protein
MWSGTPLLAGWNAGSLYPATMLFAILPGVAAWTINLVLVDVVAGLGMYVLLRVLRCVPFAAGIGALCFTYTGFMSGQLAHIGLVEGAGYLPWMLVGIELLIAASSPRACVLPMLLVGLSTGLCILAGEPRAVSSAVIVCGVYAICRIVTLRRREAARAFGIMAASAALGAGLAAIQWVPGLTFIASSQRSLNAYTAFNAGSLSWSSLVKDMLVPFLLGGNRNFGLPVYQGSYNLPEITVGVGLLPLVAAAWFLPQVTHRGILLLRRLDGRFSRAPIPDADRAPASNVRALGVWYAMAVVGLILTFGGTTPIGRILVRVPLYGGQRLQNRNAIILDLALAVLLAFFIEDKIGRHERAPRGVPSSRSRITSNHVGSVLIFVPIVGCLAVLARTRGDAIAVERRLGVVHPSVELFSRLAPYFAWTLALAIAVGIFLVLERRWSRRSCTIALAVLALADIGTYVANASFAGVPSAALAGANAGTQELAKLVGLHRVGLYNPLVLRPTTTASEAILAEPDLNVVQNVSSIQGYGSIVSGAYQAATSTHNFEGLDLTVLRNGLENSLNLGVLLTLPTYLDANLPLNGPIPLAGGGAVNNDGSSSSVVPPRAPLSSGPWSITPQTSGSWWLPGVASLDQVTIVTTPTAKQASLRLRVGLSGPGKVTEQYQTTTIGRVAHLALARGKSANEISIENLGASPAVVAAVVVKTRDPSSRLLLDGALQGWLPASQWTQPVELGPFIAFVNQHALGTAWLQPSTALAPTGEVPSVGEVDDIVAPKSGGEVMRIVARHPALLIRSVAWSPGWKASITPSGGGATRTVRVQQLGLVEAISVPVGASRVRWYYAPAGVIGSGIASLVSGGVIIVLFLVTLMRTRRRTRKRRQLGPSADVGIEA